MKKNLVLVALMAVVSMANAASLSWNLTNIYEPGTTTKASGYAAYLFIVSQTVNTLSPAAAAVKTTTVDQITNLVKSGDDFSQYVAATGASNAGGSIIGATGYNGQNFDKPDTLSAFAVIFDASSPSSASNYIITDVKTAEFTGSSGAKTLGFGSQANATWTAVPEPSTAVLALAGLALLLKRRKA